MASSPDLADGPGFLAEDLAGDYYIDVLQRLHEALAPRTYLEIGVLGGHALMHARCAAIAIDPHFQFEDSAVVAQLLRKPVLHLFALSSDDFFATRSATAIFGQPIDLAFIDGMHHCEFLLRDFYNTERHCAKNSLIVLHDCLPPEVGITVRRPGNSSPIAPHRQYWWAGDVWRTALLLKRRRPDLVITAIDAAPTGLILITNLDPTNSSLSENYQTYFDEMLSWDLKEISIRDYFAEMKVISASALRMPEGIRARLGVGPYGEGPARLILPADEAPPTAISGQNMTDGLPRWRALATPVRQEEDNRFVGGVFDLVGNFLEIAAHKRSFDGGMQFPDSLPEIPADELTHVEERCLYGGLLFNHLGHFLVESLGRLWICDQVAFAGLPLYVHPLWGEIDIETPGGFGRVTLEMLGIDPRRIRFITDPTIFDQLLIPEQLYGFHLFARPDERFRQFLHRGEARMRSAQRYTPPTPRRIYVSRSEWSADRGMVVGEREFERFLSGQGWSIFHPESKDYAEQLVHYANAEQLLFADGSAYHSLILLPNLRAEIAVIFRRSGGFDNWATTQCAGLGQKMTPLKHVIRTYPLGMPSWCAVSLVDYHAVSADLKRMGFVEREFTEWASLAEEATDRALSRYVSAIAAEPQFRAFLRTLSE